MNPKTREPRNAKAFTIIELLTVMSIIVILIGLLVPAMNQVKKYAYTVKEKAQLHAIEAAVEMWCNEMDQQYPDSSAYDGTQPPGTPVAYCGAMKLCEALMGRDLLGFHKNSTFRRDGLGLIASGTAAPLYPNNPPQDNLGRRKGPYLQLENANAYRMSDIYPATHLAAAGGLFNTVDGRDSYVLCDVFRTTKSLGQGQQAKIGMPILYYKANETGTLHRDPSDPNTPTSLPTSADSMGYIYNYCDNQDLLLLGKPWTSPPNGTNPLLSHQMADPDTFYTETRNMMIRDAIRPYRDKTFILISAGFDGNYGTSDDVTNFNQ